jgi:hypothetical protein
LARIEPIERLVEAPDRLRAHLEQRELDVALDGIVAALEILAGFRALVRAPVTKASPNVVLNFPATPAQPASQLHGSRLPATHDRLQRHS